MSGYTSGVRHADPEPWLWEERHVHIRYADYQDGPVGAELSHAPRPEFDNHNPILVEWREHKDDGPVGYTLTGNGRASQMEHFLTSLESASADRVVAQIAFGHHNGPRITAEHVRHAYRVLTKLAVLPS